MFQSLTQNFNKIFDKLRNRKDFTEENIKKITKEIKNVLIDSDVDLNTVDYFVKRIEKIAVGQKVIQSLSFRETFVNIVHKELIQLLSSEKDLDIKISNSTTKIMLVGLQGSGKTTTCAKLGYYFKGLGYKVLLVSLDVHRFAAIEQLNTLAKKLNIDYPRYFVEDDLPKICKVASKMAPDYDLVIYDTAGRGHLDVDMMTEVKELQKELNPSETIFVADALTGQNAAKIAKVFNDQIHISGVILTKMDSDSRGGAALSIKHTIGKPIKFIGVSEYFDGIEKFNPEGVASRILDMGDILSLIKNAERIIGKQNIKEEGKKITSGRFNLNDYIKHISMAEKMGGLTGILKFLPGASRFLSQNEQRIKNVNDDIFAKHKYIISSMTKKERLKPILLNTSRKKRIALGSGTSESDVDKLMKQFNKVRDMMKKMKDNPQAMMQNVMNIMKD